MIAHTLRHILRTDDLQVGLPSKMHMVNRKMAAKPLQQPMCLWLFCFLIIEIAFIKTENIENVLNVPQVLLPFASKSTKPTTFLLKAYRGCFRW